MRPHHCEGIKAFNCLTSSFLVCKSAECKAFTTSHKYQFSGSKKCHTGLSQTLRMQFSFQPCLGDSVGDTKDLQQVTEMMISAAIAEISLISAAWLLFKIFFCGDRIIQSSRCFFQKRVTFQPSSNFICHSLKKAKSIRLSPQSHSLKQFCPITWCFFVSYCI